MQGLKQNRTEQILFRCQKTHKHKLRFFFTFCNCSNRQLRRDQWSSSQATAQIQILCMVGHSLGSKYHVEKKRKLIPKKKEFKDQLQ